MSELHVCAYPAAPGSSCCLGGDWPLGPHELLLHPLDLAKLGIPPFSHVKLEGLVSSDEGSCRDALVFLRPIPEDSVGQGNTHVPEWVMRTLELRPEGYIVITALPCYLNDMDCLRPLASVEMRLTALGSSHLEHNMPRDKIWGGIPQNLDLASALARRAVGSLVFPGSWQAVEVLGEVRVFKVESVTSDDSSINEHYGKYSKSSSPLLFTRNTEVIVLKGMSSDDGLLEVRPHSGPHLGTPSEKVAMGQPWHQPNLDPRCGSKESVWKKRAVGLEEPLTDLHELLLLALGGLAAETTGANVESPTSSIKHSFLSVPPLSSEKFHDDPGIKLPSLQLPPLIPPGKGLKVAEVLPQGIAICGPSGVGKTLALDILSEDLQDKHGVHNVRLLAPEILSGFSLSGSEGNGMLGDRLSNALAEANSHAPSVIMVDELDVLLDALDDEGEGGRGMGGIRSEGAQAAGAFLSMLDSMQPGGGVAVLGVTRRSPGGRGGAGYGGGGGGVDASIPATFCKPGRLDRCVEISPPTQASREGILRLLLKGQGADTLEQLGPPSGSVLGLESRSGSDVTVHKGAAAPAHTMAFAPGGGVDRDELGDKDLDSSAVLVTWAERLSILTPGFVGGDLTRLIEAARAHAFRRRQRERGVEVVSAQDSETTVPPLGPMLLWTDALMAVAEIVPRSLLGVEVSSSRRDLTWEAVGGYGVAKDRLQRLVQWPWQHPEAFARMGISAPSGALLYGPSGCGKSLFAQVLASECLANFVWVRSSELFSRYLGESEERFRSLFAKARAAAPCILFLDELDAITAKRDDPSTPGSDADDGGVHSRVLSTLLNEMDGVATSSSRREGSKGKGAGGRTSSGVGGCGVLVLAATNRREALDAALLRPGRLQESILLDLPSGEDRLGVLRVHAGRLPLGVGVDLERLSREDLSGGMSCSDLEATCREAAMMALREDLEGATEVKSEHLIRALEGRRAGRLRMQRFTFSVGSA